MGLLEALGIPFNAAEGTVQIPLWLAATTAALVVGLCCLIALTAFRHSMSGPAALFPTTGVLSAAAILAFIGLALWGALSWTSYQRHLERRWLETRLSALQGQAQAPGSPLACLTSFGNGALEAACEDIVFATGESTAKALDHTAARIELLEDAARFTRAQDPAFEARISSLRKALETDSFGLVAHVLGARPDCTADLCSAIEVFHDSDRIRANLREGTFERHLTRAAARWQTGSAHATAPLGPDAEARPLVATPLRPEHKLPSAASIPPVSIMTTEPAAPAPEEPPTAAPAAHRGAAPTPPPRPSRSARRASEPQANSPPDNPRQEPQPLRLQP